MDKVKKYRGPSSIRKNRIRVNKNFHNKKWALIESLGAKCSSCGFDEVLDIHHISDNEVVLLCPNCHAKLHRLNGVVKYGKVLTEQD